MSFLALCSWSGGKDCALAVYRARKSGLDVRFLLAMMDESGELSRSHAVSRELLELQARVMGCELVTRSASWQSYQSEFVGALEELKSRGVEHAVFGDIDLQAHRDWEEEMCARANLAAILPLWNEPRAPLAEEVLSLGFRAQVVCVAARWLDESFCGRAYDAQFLADLPADVDACGENGEFHTFVFDGPGFKSPLSVEVEDVYEHALPPEMGAARFFYARLRSAEK